MPGSTSGAVVVTGASSGIGRATALLLDSRGYRVFAGVRKDEDARELSKDGSDRLVPIILDVTHSGQIEAARDLVVEAVGTSGLAGLVNNAGVGDGGPVETLDLDAFRHVIEVNLVGQLAVTQAFLPLLRRAKGTVVFIASIGGRVASPFMSPYNSSKFAIEALGESLRSEVEPWEIDVAVVEPGSIDTPIWSKGAETIDKQTERMSEDAMETAERGIPPEKVAEAIHDAISSDKPRHRYLVGRDAKIAARLKGTLPDRVFSKLVARQTKLPTDVPPE